MLAVRQRSACIARKARPSVPALRPATRAYASDHGHDHHHDHHHAPEVNESPGMAFYVALGAIGSSMAIYSITRPSEGSEPSGLRKWIDSFRQAEMPKWAERNTLRTDIFDQAAADRHMFGSVEKAKSFQYRTPELLNSGCPNNVPAGHGVNLDHVVEHYRKQHLDEEERKAKKLAEARKE
ncbi:hypothetical protein N0V93_001059 [Gnomoniopsis smithogilvyi]|uniref:NADH-ubiquinone oxidoreductase 17.8 kDa subunit n=1 Tax=Gnomoniopsis smithogilvyi TaxID=1191159 RepID=A0A9W8Z572_9PEZI|nr:hypothetical protein N0V93_001059 [Gnomoniopsis smithogilvyi]